MYVLNIDIVRNNHLCIVIEVIITATACCIRMNDFRIKSKRTASASKNVKPSNIARCRKYLSTYCFSSISPAS